MNKILLIICLTSFLLIPLAHTETSTATLNWLTKGRGDTLYCGIANGCQVRNFSAYGEMWNRSAPTTPWNFTIPAAGIYYNLTGLQEGENIVGFTFTDASQNNGGSYLTAQYVGTYKIDATVSFIIPVSGGLYGFAVGHNFDPVPMGNCYARRQASNTVGNVGITCIITLAIGDTINIMVEDESAPARDMLFHNVNINIIEITPQGDVEAFYTATSPITLTGNDFGFNYGVTNTWTGINTFQTDFYIASNVYHEGDSDTYRGFTPDAQNFYVGGARVIDFNSQFGLETLNLVADSIKLDGSTLITNKLKFTQTDGNEYIDSLRDAELDIEATTSVNFRINKAEQVQVFNGKLIPSQTNDIDLGDSTHFYKDVYIAGEVLGSLVYLCGCGTNTASFSTGYLKFYNGMLMAAKRGCTMTSDGSITKIGSGGSLSVAAAPASIVYNARINGSGVFDCTIPSTYGVGEHACVNTQDRNIDTFNKGDILSCYVAESISPPGSIDVDFPRMGIWGYLNE